MRQTDEHRRRRHRFMNQAVVLAFKDTDVEVTITPGGTKHGVDAASAVLGAVTVDGATMGKGFSVLWEDRRDHGRATGLSGVSTKWRDDMLHARLTSNLELVSQDDVRKVLALGLAALA